MALTATSTEQNAIDQYYNNVDGWLDDLDKAKALKSAMDWLLLRHQMASLSAAGRSLALSESFNTLYQQVSQIVAANSSLKQATILRGRISGGGAW